MTLTCEVILSFLSFRIRSLNLIRAVEFGKSREGPTKEVSLMRCVLGTGPERQPIHTCCPCFPEHSMEEAWGCPGFCPCKGTFQLGAEELSGCCTSPCLCLGSVRARAVPGGLESRSCQAKACSCAGVRTRPETNLDITDTSETGVRPTLTAWWVFGSPGLGFPAQQQYSLASTTSITVLSHTRCFSQP